ncbi:hypothetical protein MesoLj113a_65250 [Mesorhizobium sp. 113-1-2]|uniref:hypothetical protein n=1 Tax=Mesorhizobium sp. 113-1-2 TaxID=2744515 RepID=UPI00192792AA|nr:hypothetical protein [Mesorhizobium sp. 113-1-2]BCG75367.1 hypothetical protein MesoLj113a_65250 [Mesorhizobium sp. 113-1-2]
MDDDLRMKLKELSASMQSRANELALPGGNTDISALMSGIAVTLEALLVIAEEARGPRSGPSLDAGTG